MPSRKPPSAFRLAQSLTVLLGIALFATKNANAKECGDDLAGVRVPCACGDTVVGDTKLLATDPVVRQRCSDGGLTILARDLAETITLDLQGLSLIGSGVGDGIAVQSGGSDGAVIVGSSNGRRAQIVGFGTGINVPVARAARRIEAVEVSGNRHEGLMLNLAGTMVFDVKASRNGGDGIRAVGQGGRILDTETSENGGTGIRLESRYSVVQARSERNKTNGIIVRGTRNDLAGSVANDNHGYGVVLGGMNQGSDRIVTEGNSSGGIGNPGRRQPS